MKRLTDAAYWDQTWQEHERPRKLLLYRDFDYETVRVLGDRVRSVHAKGDSRRPRVLELGGGGSRVLPYLSRKFDCEAHGTDFSWSGCRLLRANFALQSVRGNVICEDLFQSSLPDGAFDIVYSSGLIEHFDDTRAVIAEHVRLLRPAGELVLIVPNLEGIQGRIWKRCAPPLWNRHHVFGPGELAALLEGLGLERVRSGYLGSFFIHIGRGPEWSGLAPWARLPLHASVRVVNAAVSLGFRLSPWRPHSRALSPAFFAAGVKPVS